MSDGGGGDKGVSKHQIVLKNPFEDTQKKGQEFSVKYCAWEVLKDHSDGLNVTQIAKEIQERGLKDFSEKKNAAGQVSGDLVRGKAVFWHDPEKKLWWIRPLAPLPANKRQKAKSSDSLINSQMPPKCKKIPANRRSKAKPHGKALVGARVAVWWAGENTFFEGKIDAHHTSVDRYRVIYDDGDADEAIQFRNYEIIKKHGRIELVKVLEHNLDDSDPSHGEAPLPKPPPEQECDAEGPLQGAPATLVERTSSPQHDEGKKVEMTKSIPCGVEKSEATEEGSSAAHPPIQEADPGPVDVKPEVDLEQKQENHQESSADKVESEMPVSKKRVRIQGEEEFQAKRLKGMDNEEKMEKDETDESLNDGSEPAAVNPGEQPVRKIGESNHEEGVEPERLDPEGIIPPASMDEDQQVERHGESNDVEIPTQYSIACPGDANAGVGKDDLPLETAGEATARNPEKEEVDKKAEDLDIQDSISRPCSTGDEKGDVVPCMDEDRKCSCSGVDEHLDSSPRAKDSVPNSVNITRRKRSVMNRRSRQPGSSCVWGSIAMESNSRNSEPENQDKLGILAPLKKSPKRSGKASKSHRSIQRLTRRSASARGYNQGPGKEAVSRTGPVLSGFAKNLGKTLEKRSSIDMLDLTKGLFSKRLAMEPLVGQLGDVGELMSLSELSQELKSMDEEDIDLLKDSEVSSAPQDPSFENPPQGKGVERIVNYDQGWSPSQEEAKQSDTASLREDPPGTSQGCDEILCNIQADGKVDFPAIEKSGTSCPGGVGGPSGPEESGGSGEHNEKDNGASDNTKHIGSSESMDRTNSPCDAPMISVKGSGSQGSLEQLLDSCAMFQNNDDGDNDTSRRYKSC